MLILGIISIFISYNFYSYYLINKKSLFLKNNNNYPKKILKKLKIESNISKIENELNNLGNPYGIDIKKYIIIKYFLSVVLSVIMYINSKNIFVSVFMFVSFFMLPNLIIKLFKKNESVIVVEDISNIVQNIVLSLSANMTLYDSLKNSINSINYKRLKVEYSQFVQNYLMYNFNIYKAISIFENKFNSILFDSFLSLLAQGEKEGNLIEILETYSDSLVMEYMKTLKYKESKRMLGIVFVTIVILLNSFVIVMYPLIMQIASSFKNLFG